MLCLEKEYVISYVSKLLVNSVVELIASCCLLENFKKFTGVLAHQVVKSTLFKHSEKWVLDNNS